MKKFLLLLTIFLGISAAAQDSRVRLACIGDSITFGYGLKSPFTDSYPAVLQGLLGDGFEVRNFGFSARTMGQGGDRPYMKEKMYSMAKEFLPEIVVLMIGTNDIKPENWNPADFEDSYNLMLTELEALGSHPAIYVCLPSTIHGERWGMTDENMVRNAIPIIRKVARSHRLRIIDIHSATKDLGNHFPDFIHPDTEASKVIADTVYDFLCRRNPAVRKATRAR